MLVEKTHAYNGYAEIAGRFELVAGHITEAARINGKRLAQHKFHGEIRNGRKAGTRVRLLEPALGFLESPYLSVELGEKLLEVWIGGNTLQSFPGRRLQHDPRIMGQFPEFRVDPFPKLIRRVIEGPSQVQGQFREGI